MSELSLFLLGSPRIERDGQIVRVDTRKAIALLAYLAMNIQPQSRERLAALLYPEVDERRARAALRRTLSALKAGLGDPWLRTSRDEIQLHRGRGYWCDVDQFHRHLEACRGHGHGASDVCADCLPSLAEAARLYQDDFLAGFTLRDSASFEEWQSLQVEGLRRQLTGALERLVRGLTAQGKIEDCHPACSAPAGHGAHARTRPPGPHAAVRLVGSEACRPAPVPGMRAHPG